MTESVDPYSFPLLLGELDLRSLADRTSVPELQSFVLAMVQADSFGIAIGVSAFIF